MLLKLSRTALLGLAAALAGAPGGARSSGPPAPGSSPGDPPAGPRDAGGIVAIVGDDAIARAELDRQLRQWVAQLGREFPAIVLEREIPRLEWLLLERMIGDKLFLQEVRKEEAKQDGKPFVPEAEVDFFVRRQFESRREKNPGIRTIDDWYDAVAKEEGLGRKEYRTILKERIEVDKYVRRYVLRGVDAYVSPEEVRAYYREHLGEFTTPKEISFRQIRIQRTEQALLLKEAIDKGLKDGVPFAELAAKYSEEADPSLAGRLWTKAFEEVQGWHRPIPEVLRRLGKGQVSEPVFTERGIFYFYMEDVVPGEPKSFGEVQESIRKKLAAEREDAAVKAALKKLLERSHVVRFLEKPPGVAAEELGGAP